MRASADGTALFLRCLVPPVKLLSAATWRLIQQEDVKNYGLLEEFVTFVTDTVPDMLSGMQRAQLTIGLRAKLVLELCSMEKPEDPEMVQAHLQRITTLVALYKELGLSDPCVEETGINFVALVESLLKDSAEKNSFFKEVYPLQYGVKFNTALKKLMWLFLFRLESLLPQLTMEETAHMLSTAPTVMEDCIQSLSQPQQLQSLFKYPREVNLETEAKSQLWSSVPDDCILSCIGSCRVASSFTEATANTDTLPVSVLDYPPSYCEEVQVESVVIAQYIDNNLEMRPSVSEENSNDVECFDDGENNEQTAPENASEVIYEAKSLDCRGADVVVEENSEKLDAQKSDVTDSKKNSHIGQNVVANGQTMEKNVETPELAQENVVDESDSILASKGEHTNSDDAQQKTSALVTSYITKQPCVKIARLDLTDRTFLQPSNPGPPKQRRGRPRKNTPDTTAPCKMKKQEITVTVPRSSTDKSSGTQDFVSRVIQKLKETYTEVKGLSALFACSLCTFKNHEEIQLHHHLISHHPEEYKRLCETGGAKGKSQCDVSAPHDPDSQQKPLPKMRSYRGVPVSKTCPTCGKTFTRSSDMRRHQVSHSADRPFTCLYCEKTFRYTFDLRRHQQNTCANRDYVVLDQRQASEVPENGRESGSPSINKNELQPSTVQSFSSKQPSASKQESTFCHLCRITLPNFTSLKSHMESHSRGNLHICPCGKTYKHLDSMRTHQLGCPESDLHKQERSTDNERDTIKNKKELLCGNSGDVPQGPSNVVKSSEKNDIETTEATSSSSLVPCVLSDSGETPQVASSDKPALITQSPPGSIIVVFDTRKHLRSASASQPHKCPHCGDSFKCSYTLKKHEGVCEGSKQPKEAVPLDSGEHNTTSHITSSSQPTEPSTRVPPGPPLAQTPLSIDDVSQTTKSLFTCEKCERKFKGLIMLRKHRKICSGSNRRYRCVKCGSIFKTLLDVRKHVPTHWGEDPLQCPQCGKYFQNPSDLTKHKVAHEREHSYPCTLCHDAFYRVDSLRQHYLEVHEFKGPYQCPHCDKTHAELSAIFMHSRTHSDERPYQCSHCSKRFKQRSGLNVHEKLHSGDRPFLCETCGKCFGSNIQLQRHLVCHSTERPYACPQCKKCFKSQQVLRVHILKHSRQASIPCEFCGKMFAQAYALHRHHRTHTGERPFGCPKCGKTFLTSGEVAKHLRFHTGERPFQCTHCSKNFTQACYLTTHMRVHTGERPYKCSVCEKSFIINTHLKRHMFVHTKEKPFKCECGKAFNRINLLNMHRKKQCVLQRD